MDQVDLDDKWEKAFRRPYVTYLLCGLCTLMFFFQCKGDAAGLNYPGYVDGYFLAQGQYWGLLTSFFLHANFAHLFFNLYWIYRFGSVVESHIGWWRYFLFWLGATLISGMAEYAVEGDTGIGASGFGYALFGLVWVGSRSRRYLSETLDANTVALFILWFLGCTALTWMGTVSVGNAAHAGGFLFGAWCAYAFFMRDEPHLKEVTVALTLLALVPLFYAPWLSSWNLAQATRAYGRENFESTVAYLNHVDLPQYKSYILELRGISLDRLGRNHEAAQAYQDLLSIPDVELADSGYIYNEYAWILATSPDEKLRNPAQAIHYAQLACEQDGYKQGNTLDTLAAAYASAGQFDQAVTWEQKAIESAASPQDVAELKDHLKLFQVQKPYIENPADSGDGGTTRKPSR